ncbi:hypothetical protein M422DRAFT_38971 [Sphaerobolus stellatus SS14]|uniref:WD40 repeat-like protein n=1 Tax=Sphaerobolus stellatus (strain SS14) TaxID=990650 RepID=A0A0C9U735_SPHS4|nr:hypothetical protein M422DRAFT_38971 [Sphaerobolus stellatus SS14]
MSNEYHFSSAHRKGIYKFHLALNGHTRGITALKFSPDTRFLASGGMDNRVRICTISGPVTDITWAVSSKGQQALIFACADGMIYIYRNMGNRFEGVIALVAHTCAVEAIDYDHHHHRLASSAGGETKIWAVREDWYTELHASDNQHGVTARTVQFLNQGDSVAITYLETSNVALWTVAPWKKLWERTFSGRLISPARAGHSRISPDGKTIVIDNIRNGMDAYVLTSAEHLTTFHAPLAHPGRPKHVAYNDDGSIVIQGSDKGIVYIADFASGAPIQTVLHGNNGHLVQVVTMKSYGEQHWMASGTSEEALSSIIIWKKGYTDGWRKRIWSALLVMTLVVYLYILAGDGVKIRVLVKRLVYLR